MIIHGGEPPVIEEPEPRFGGVIEKLNEITYSVQDQVSHFNESTREQLDSFTNGLADFITNVCGPIDAHIAAKGAQHGETRTTVGLGNKDNFRMATLAEMIALANVQAYVHPQGAKAALDAATLAFDIEDYQLNDAFHMASYYMPDEYPVVTPTVVQPPRYFSNPFVPTLVNGDRLVASPISAAGSYQRQSIMVSGPTSTAGGSQFQEVQNLNTRYLGNNWNSVGGLTAAGKVALFKPLADKKIYEFKNNLGMTTGNLNFQLYRGYASTTYKGLVVGTAVNGQVVTIEHKFFKANLADSDPTLVELITGSYTALVTQIGKTAFTTPANGSHTYNLTDFVTLAAGQTLEVGGNGAQGVATALYWNAQDYEMYLFVSIPVILRSGGAARYFNITFVESIVPGTLVSGGSAVIRQVGVLTKDVMNADMTLAAGAKWVSPSSRWDFNNPSLFPGAVLANGELVKMSANKHGVRVKRFDTGMAGIKGWVAGAKPTIDMRETKTEVYTPSRHSPFQAIPERLIPILHDATTTQYLSFSLNRENGRFGWSELVWAASDIVSVQSGDVFGVRPPDVVREVDLFNMPRSLSIYVNKSGIGAGIRPMAFTNDNNFTGYASLAYAGGVVTLGAKLSLSLGSLTTLRSAASRMRGNAMTANPTVTDSLRETQIQVFAVTSNRALIILSDGMCYAEAAVCGFTVTGTTFTLDFPASIGLVMKPVTTGGKTVTGTNRNSSSGDDVWMNGSDLLAVQESADVWRFAVSKPFGNIYGDLSFSVTAFTADQPTFTPGSVNPARCYSGNYQFDLVDELHPPLLIPAKGLYQYDPANDALNIRLRQVGGTGNVDPHVINEAGWVIIPAGSKVLILGRAYILSREYPLKVNASGTSYCYLIRVGNELQAVASDVLRETRNNEVLFGTAVNGILTIDHSYLVMDNHVVTPNRRGSAIPVFDDDGGQGVNKFFTRRDVV
ncbi:hypothetical protein D3C81_386910 [compost metagenome]